MDVLFHIISKIPVIPARVIENKLDSTTSKGKGLWLRRGSGMVSDEDVDDKDASKATKKERKKDVAKGQGDKKAIKLLKELVKDLETDDEESSTSGDDEMEKARKSLIKLRIRKPKRRLMKLSIFNASCKVM